MTMATRYDQLLALIDQHKPSRIVEVGVHRAVRAVAMVQRALKWHFHVEYLGYDVFETMGQKFQEEALNGKGMPTEAHARHQLTRAQNVAKGNRKGLSVMLEVGDTRKTLHGRPPFGCQHALAFIDGDHRVECIRADYEALKECPVVVFDDYYVPDAKGVTVDLVKYGANAVVAELEHYGAKVEVLPAADPCKHGGVIKLAVVRK
jgi:hypothetical protein